MIFNLYLIYIWIGVLVLKGTQSKNISFELWPSVLLVKESRLHSEYHRHSLIHCSKHNVVSSIPHHWEWCWPLISWEYENTTVTIFANLALKWWPSIYIEIKLLVDWDHILVFRKMENVKSNIKQVDCYML